MSDNDKDSGLPEGTNGATNSAGSDGKGDQQRSFDAAKVLAALEALDKKVAEADARSKSLQGDKDRAVSKTTKEVEDLKRQLAEIRKLEKSGLEPDAAVEEYSFRETVRQLKEVLQQNVPVPAKTAGNSVSGADPTAQLIESLKLDSNDAGVLKIVAETQDPILRAAKLGEYKASRVQTAPSPADAGTLNVGPAKTADTTGLAAKLSQWYKNPSAHQAEIAAAEKELGWNK